MYTCDRSKPKNLNKNLMREIFIGWEVVPVILQPYALNNKVFLNMSVVGRNTKTNEYLLEGGQTQHFLFSTRLAPHNTSLDLNPLICPKHKVDMVRN